MKKQIALALICTMALTTACGNNTNTDNNVEVKDTEVLVETETVNEENNEGIDEVISEELVEETASNYSAVPASPYLKDIDTSTFEINEAAFSYSSIEFANLLKAGWNLGNTLDAQSTKGLDSEMAWGQPRTTKECIDFIKESGFTSIRIPVSWGLHTSGPDYKIDEAWMARVKEIVDWAIDADLYVIINSHHDNDFYYPTKDHMEKSVYYIDCIWSQIADTFRDYDEKLIFEGMNEPRLKDTDLEWYFEKGNPQGVEAVEVIGVLNQRFVDVVRASGGNNTLRYLMMSGYAGNPDLTIDNDFVISTDPANHLLMSIHAYTPYDFAMNIMGYRTWDPSLNTEFAFMDKAKEYFIDKGIGVSITEMGATNKNNLQPRTLWFYYYTQKASELGISCFVWDNGKIEIGEECFGFVNRVGLEIYYPSLMEGLTINYRDEAETE